MKKIYAKQVPPEHQESPLFFGEWPEDVFVFGNRDYDQHDERIEEICSALENIAETYEEMQRGEACTNNLHAFIWYELPREDGRGYSRDERKHIVRLAQMYAEEPPKNTRAVLETICMALRVVCGREYEWSTIRGCGQCDWQQIIYPAEYGKRWLDEFEAEYFNTGEEWCVDDGDGRKMYVYTHTWRDDEKRAEIADAIGCDPGNVVLYAFDGWAHTPKYKEVV